MLRSILKFNAAGACLVVALMACDAQSPPDTEASPARDTSPAGEASPAGDVGQGQLQPSRAPGEPLLELSYRGGIIAHPDPTPFVRVYPDGRVLVHYPAYMKRAGDYSMQLNDEQLRELLASFSNEGVLMLEPEELSTMSREMQAEMSEPQLDDHGVESVVRIRGESFTPQGSARPLMFNVDQTIRARNDLLRAAPRSNFDNLKNLATGIQGLEELARSDALEQIE